MARMAQNFASSMTRGNDEYTEWKCTQCNIAGKTSDATLYCLDCNEYYCDGCVKFHTRIPCLKVHTLMNEAQKDSFDQRHCQKDVELESKEKEIKLLQEEIRILKETTAQIPKLQEERDQKDMQYANLTEEYVKLTLERQKMDKERELMNSHIESYQRQIKDLESRYNQVASAKLKDNNPDIVDLSDPNRALKLAERYGELFHDTWTDAYMAQQDLGIPDRDVIHDLLNVLKESYKFCEALSGTQLESLSSVLLYPCQDPFQRGGSADKTRISSSNMKILKDLRRQIVTDRVEVVKQSEKLVSELELMRQNYHSANDEIKGLRMALEESRTNGDRLHKESELVVRNVNTWAKEQKAANEKLGNKIREQSKAIMQLTAEKDHIVASVLTAAE